HYCDDFIDLTAGSSEASDFEIPEIDIDDLGLKQKGKIIKLHCNVKFIKLVPLDLKTTPFVVLICKETHIHLAPPPVNIPTGIQINLNHIINEAPKHLNKQRTKSNIESNKIEQTNTDLNEIERKLAIREKEIALEERETELELKKLNMQK
ncbi:1351_t:CDS:2, partial [Gigaspora margarita]